MPFRTLWIPVLNGVHLILIRLESPLNGAAAPLTALPTSPGNESYSVSHFMVFVIKSLPCLLAAFTKQSRPEMRMRGVAFQERCTPTVLPLLQVCHFSIKGPGFFSSGRKIKARGTPSYKSVAGNKVMHFTAYDPNTRCAKLAFSHLNWHKMCWGWHFILPLALFAR